MSELNDAPRKILEAQEVFNQLIAIGEQLSDGRHIIHYFYGVEDRLPGLRAELEAECYLVRDSAAGPGLVAETVGVVGAEWAAETMPVLCDLADKYDAEYDGWEASAVRQPKPGKPGLLKSLFGKGG
jgi:hypothetical protein